MGSRKIIYTLLLALMPGFWAFAQDKKPVVPVQKDGTSKTAESSEDDDSADDESDEALSSTKVMVIPFNPSYYNTDIKSEYANADKNKKVEQAKDFAKFGLEKNVKARIVSGSGKKKDDLGEFSSEADKDINKIYESITYQYEKRDNKFAQKNSLIGSLLKRLQNSQKAKDAYQSDEKHKEYMNVVIADPKLLPSIAKKYGVEIFVFINQYEIFTNYKKLIDPVNKIYQRQIKLHFSIFDGTGQQIYGDVATVSFQGVSKDIDEIILNRFPVVANYVSSAVKKADEDADDTSAPENNVAPANSTPVKQPAIKPKQPDDKSKSKAEDDGGDGN